MRERHPRVRSSATAPDAGDGDPLAWVRERFEVWNREGLEAFAERFWHDDVVWEEPAGVPDAGVRRGREACIRRMKERLSLLGHVQVEVLDARQSGQRRFVEVLVSGKGSASGAPTTMREYFVSDMRGDQVVHWREFLDRDAALAAMEAA